MASSGVHFYSFSHLSTGSQIVICMNFTELHRSRVRNENFAAVTNRLVVDKVLVLGTKRV